MSVLRTVTATGLAATLVVAGASAGLANPGTPGQPQPATVVFHEDFQNAPVSGLRTVIDRYVGADGHTYDADPYWKNAVKANGMVVSAQSTFATTDATGAKNDTETTARATLRQLAEALGKVNGSSDPRSNLAISAYTQDVKASNVADNLVMLRTKDDIELKDANGRFLAFSLNAAATNGVDKAHPDRENPRLMFYVNQAGTGEQALTSTPIDPITDPRSQTIAVTASANGTKEPVRGGQFASDRSFLYEGGAFGVVVRNLTSGHLGNDGAFDDLQVIDVTPQLDKAFDRPVATTGESVRLVLTVTNTDELAAKEGWTFADELADGLRVADQPNLVSSCVGDAWAQGTKVAVTNGSLAAGQASCTVEVDVTSTTSGTYSNGPANIVVRKGIDAPAEAVVRFEAPGDLVVHHVDENGAPLAADQTSSGRPGEAWSSGPLDIDGYTVVRVDGPATGTYAEGTTAEVTYVYKPVAPLPVPGALVVHHQTADGISLADDEHVTGDAGDPYSTQPQQIDGYVLVRVEGDPTGTLPDGTAVVTYVYAPTADPDPEPADATGTLVVHYVAEDGSPLADDTTSTDEVGATYGTAARSFDGWTLVRVDGSTTGTYVDGTVEVTYVYRPVPPAPKPGSLVVHHQTADGTPLADDDTTTGDAGDPYSTQPKHIDGYVLVRVDGDPTGTLPDGTVVVTYVYEPVATPDPTPTPDPEPQPQPAPEPTPTVVPVLSEVLAADPVSGGRTGSLAHTGSEGVPLAGLAGLTAAAGLALVLVTRRSRRER
ncbi:hypothetical protein CTKZ_35230 [Cellulomonas algicola]|uniref:Gram-positive cocci surface proteins LPxTG domain-containing protein n=1 Tax=Cellulomonas algicola TaxID=2071633 RepID=A0A401V511_9CELL|nr:MucBP domain-containing protein [Cellulomonas algicola]GCD21961.1 hypothetical protein CTKZ_35230 [Cellulomonas algicola]